MKIFFHIVWAICAIAWTLSSILQHEEHRGIDQRTYSIVEHIAIIGMFISIAAMRFE